MLDDSDMFYPIPQAAIDVNPNLTQNPGYWRGEVDRRDALSTGPRRAFAAGLWIVPFTRDGDRTEQTAATNSRH